ncbi:MAG: hypothetical protein PHF57_05485 [Methanoregula sp.]|nr:hypothetical protein [Methanoregula sp.]MDD5187640.1 hypothetical protein [Methanoregula sp.]
MAHETTCSVSMREAGSTGKARHIRMVSWAVASGAYPAAPEPAEKPVRTWFDGKRCLRTA